MRVRRILICCSFTYVLMCLSFGVDLTRGEYGHKAEEQKIPITKRALVQRINRHLRKQNEALRGKRGENTGEYYRVDTNRNVLIEERVALEKSRARARRPRSL